ncbi:hypothetical protein ACE1TI_12610 [Alteribacillus sp. JSM 102045]|uniref:hypothetical protein n=1 Tax=Alteribacillus sp. JSM 102045 TaxID=1562101 RepID=UPI0035BF301E
MKKNESFLPTWHAYLGYRFDLFDYFKKPADPKLVADTYQLDHSLLDSRYGLWIWRVFRTDL